LIEKKGSGQRMEKETALKYSLTVFGARKELIKYVIYRLSQNSNQFYNWIMSNVDFKFRS
jgi:hypothetical protein